MANQIELGGVHTWYEEHGGGEPLVLLHPGGADARAFAPNLDAVAERFHVFTPERRGHGRTPDVEGPITYDLMAQDTIAFLDHVVGAPAHLIGYSDGAIVALMVALCRPDLVRRLVSVSGVIHHNGWVPGATDLDDTTADFFASTYGELSPDGPVHYPIIRAKLTRMHAEEPTLEPSAFAALTVRTLVMVGDDDEVQLEHTLSLYRSLSDSELAVVPGTSHGLLVEKPEICNKIILDFLAEDPIPTIAPVRRATRTSPARG